VYVIYGKTASTVSSVNATLFSVYLNTNSAATSRTFSATRVEIKSRKKKGKRKGKEETSPVGSKVKEKEEKKNRKI